MIAIVFTLMCLVQVARADDAATIAAYIENLTYNDLSATVSGSTVTVTGNMPVTPSTGNYLTLNIDAGVTVKWQANLAGNTLSLYSLISLSGPGAFHVESGTINNNGSGRAITNASTGVIIVSGGLITSGGNYVIYLNNSGTATAPRLIITGGTVEGGSTATIYNYSSGGINVSGGTVSNAGSGDAIYNYAFSKNMGAVNVSGDANINAINGNAVYCDGYSSTYTRTLNITGGTITATTGVAVNNQSYSSANISGGTIGATTGRAIYNTGTMTVSGSAKVTSASADATIYNYSMLNVSGGILENTAGSSAVTGSYAQAIRNSGNTHITGGTVKSENGDAIYHISNELNISRGIVSTNGSRRSAVFSTRATDITGGTVSTGKSDGYAVFHSNDQAILDLGGNPTITGRIYAYPEKINTRTITSDTPEIKVYILDFPAEQYVEGNIAVNNGRDFPNHFQLYNSGFMLYPVGANLVIYPAITQYTVTFDANGGSVSPAAGTTSVGYRLLSLPVPERERYTFAGWFTAATGGAEVTLNTVFDSDSTIYAQWIPSYAITFNAGGGTIAVPGQNNASVFSENFENGNGFTLINGSQRNGWIRGIDTRYSGSYSAYISYNGSINSYDFESSSIVHMYKDITFPASSSDFTLTFYFKGYGESGYDDMSVRYSTTNDTPAAGLAFSKGTTIGTVYRRDNSWSQKTITLPAATFSGKTMRLVFSWRNDGSGGFNPPAAIDDINISYTPTIASATGTGTTGIGGKLLSLFTPARDGYTFAGWFTAATGGTEVTLNTVFDSDSTVYAQWTLDT